METPYKEVTDRELSTLLFAMFQLCDAIVPVYGAYEEIKKTMPLSLGASALVDAALKDADAVEAVRLGTGHHYPDFPWTRQFQSLVPRGPVYADVAEALQIGEFTTLYGEFFGSAAVFILLSRKSAWTESDQKFIDTIAQVFPTGSPPRKSWLRDHVTPGKQLSENSSGYGMKGWLHAHTGTADSEIKTVPPYIRRLLISDIQGGVAYTIPAAIGWDLFNREWDKILK